MQHLPLLAEHCIVDRLWIKRMPGSVGGAPAPLSRQESRLAESIGCVPRPLLPKWVTEPEAAARSPACRRLPPRARLPAVPSAAGGIQYRSNADTCGRGWRLRQAHRVGLDILRHPLTDLLDEERTPTGISVRRIGRDREAAPGGAPAILPLSPAWFHPNQVAQRNRVGLGGVEPFRSIGGRDRRNEQARGILQ